MINAIAVSGGGGGAGATQSSVEYSKLLTVASLNKTTDKRQEIPIGPDITNITVKHLSGSGAGGGGASWTSAGGSGGAPTSQADCDPFNALFIPAKYNGTGGKNLCVTKYNVGDTNGPTIATGIKVITTGTSDTCLASSTNCCWNGNTSNSGSCTTWSRSLSPERNSPPGRPYPRRFRGEPFPNDEIPRKKQHNCLYFMGDRDILI